jgi:competence protein ComEC
MLFLFFLAGVALFYSYAYFPFLTLSVGILCSVYLFFRKKPLLIFIILLGITFSFLRFEQEKDISHIANREVIATGTFQSYPVKTGSGNFMQFFDIKSAVDNKSGGRYREFIGKKVTLFADREFRSGSGYKILIQIFRERIRQNPGSLNSDEIHAGLLKVIEPVNNSSSFISRIQELRYRLSTYYSEHFKKDSAAFVSSITIGQRTLMNEDLRNAFNVTGLAHILSISGTHFGLFSVFLFSIFRFTVRALPYKILQRITIYLTPSQAASILTFPFMLAYFVLSGGSIPAVRSFIMISLFLLGLLIGRKGLWLNALLFAACVLTLWDPKVILDLSFQLSFLAVLFIGFAVETGEDESKQEDTFSEEKKFHQVVKKCTRYLRNALLLTLSASIGTAPLVAYHFHYFSIISPLSNLLIAPLIGFILIPLSLFSSFLFLLTGHYVFAPVVSTVSDMSIRLVLLFSDIPFADIKMPAFPIIVVLLFYAGFLVYFLSGKKRYTLIIPFLPVLLYFLLSLSGKRELAVTYLDVGQGDSAVIELPDRKTIVIDTGRTGRETASYLKYKGKKVVDALVLSHIHPDHTGGLDYLVKRFEIKELWDNGRMILPENVMSYIKDKHRILQRGDVLERKGHTMYIFHPYPEFYSLSGNEYVGANNDSLVLRIAGSNSSFLFAGDIEEEAEENLSSLGNFLGSDVIKVPHHGGKTSAYKPFFELVSPEVAVISIGRNNAFGHPHDEMIDTLQGIRIFRTDTDGAVKIQESAHGLKIKTFKDFQLERTGSFTAELQNIKRLFQTW